MRKAKLQLAIYNLKPHPAFRVITPDIYDKTQRVITIKKWGHHSPPKHFAASTRLKPD